MENEFVRCLTLMKKEQNKRNILYKNGVDLSNYENGYLTACIDLLVHSISLFDCKTKLSKDNIKEYLDWWLFESSEKKIYVENKTYNVSSAKQIINFLLRV